jgi:hypothetical protein
MIVFSCETLMFLNGYSVLEITPFQMKIALLTDDMNLQVLYKYLAIL